MIGFNDRIFLAAGVVMMASSSLATASTSARENLGRHLEQNERVDKFRQLREFAKVLGPANPELVTFVNDGLEKILADFLPSPYEVLNDQELVRDSIDLGICDMGYHATATSVKVYDLHKNIHVKEISSPIVGTEGILNGELELQTTLKMELVPTLTTADIVGAADCGSVEPEASGNVRAYIAGDYEMSVVAKVTLCDDGIDVSVSVPSVDFEPRITNVDLSLKISCDYEWYQVHAAALCTAVQGAYSVLKDEIEDQAESMLNNDEVDQLLDDVEVTVAVALEDMANEKLGDWVGTCSV